MHRLKWRKTARKKRTSAGKRKWNLKQICTNEARSTTRWINGDSCSLNVKRWRAQEHQKNSSKSEQNSGEERQNENWKQETSMDQEPYPNQEEGCTKGLDGARYQLMDVLGVGEEEDPWKTPKRRWNTTEMKIRARRALGNGGFWWRWRVEVKLWYGRWLEEMKEKVSHVCSQNNRRVEWSQHKHSIRNFKS